MNAPTPHAASTTAQALVRLCALDESTRAQEVLRSNDPMARLEQLGDEAERAAARDPHWAVAAGEALLATALLLGDSEKDAPRVIARLRRATTLALAYAGRLEESIALGRDNRASALAAGECIEAARALLSLMHPLLKSGRTQEAIAAGESAHAEFMQAKRRDLAARADINLGNVRKSLGDSVSTLRHLDRAMALLGSDGALAAHIENTRGEALLALDRFAEARAAFARAMEWARRTDSGFAIGVIEGNLADLAARSGALHEALELFARARGTVSARGHAARLLLEEADVLLALGLAPLAAHRLRESLAIVDHAGLAFEGLRATLALARARAAFGDVDEAKRLAENAAQRAAALHDAPGEARAHAMHALLLAEQGQCLASADALQRARACDPTPAPSDEVGRLLIQSRLQARQSQGPQAMLTAQAAATLAAEIGAAPLVCDAHVQLATLLRGAGCHSEAVAAATMAVQASERVRSALGAELLRRAYLGRSIDAHEELVLAHLGVGSPNSPIDAFEAAERGKGRSLLERALVASDGSSAPHAASGSPMPAKLQNERVAQVRGQLEAIYRTMAQGAAGSMEHVHGRIARLESQLSELEVEAASATSATGHVAAATSAPCIQAALASDEALVEYYRAAGEWIAFVVTRSGVQSIRLGVGDASITEAVTRLGFQVRKALRDARMGRAPQLHATSSILDALGEALWAPLARAQALPSRLVIVPHGPLHAVPFAALRGEGKWMIDCHETCMLPSASLLPVLAERTPQGAGSRSLVVGVADEHAPTIREEAIAVARALEVEPLLDAQATSETVALGLSGADRAHVACHGQFLPEAPWSSGLQLADRWFGARDIYDLRRSPREVVLSACDTGGLDVLAGDELTGLVHAFLARGARTVVASLWSANDASSARIMLDMYARCRTLGGPSPLSPQALREAQRAERDRSPHPAFWGPFTFTGVHR